MKTLIMIAKPRTIELLNLYHLEGQKIEAQRGKGRVKHRWYFANKDKEYSVDEGSIIPLCDNGNIGVMTRRHIAALVNQYTDIRHAEEDIKRYSELLGVSVKTIKGWAKNQKSILASTYIKGIDYE